MDVTIEMELEGIDDQRNTNACSFLRLCLYYVLNSGPYVSECVCI